MIHQDMKPVRQKTNGVTTFVGFKMYMFMINPLKLLNCIFSRKPTFHMWYRSMFSETSDEVLCILKKVKKKDKIIICGHSAGAALAIYCFDYMKTRLPHLKSRFNLYTLAMPPCCNAFYSAYHTKYNDRDRSISLNVSDVMDFTSIIALVSPIHFHPSNFILPKSIWDNRYFIGIYSLINLVVAAFIPPVFDVIKLMKNIHTIERYGKTYTQDEY